MRSVRRLLRGDLVSRRDDGAAGRNRATIRLDFMIDAVVVPGHEQLAALLVRVDPPVLRVGHPRESRRPVEPPASASGLLAGLESRPTVAGLSPERRYAGSFRDAMPGSSA